MSDYLSHFYHFIVIYWPITLCVYSVPPHVFFFFVFIILFSFTGQLLCMYSVPPLAANGASVPGIGG